MPKSPDRYLSQFDIDLYVRMLDEWKNTSPPLEIAMVEDEMTGAEALLIIRPDDAPHLLPIAGIRETVRKKGWDYLRQSLFGSVGYPNDEQRMYVAAALVRIRNARRKASNFRVVSSWHSGWSDAQLSPEILQCTRNDLQRRFPDLDGDRFEGQVHLHPRGRAQFNVVSVPIDPRPSGSMRQALEYFIKTPFVEWALGLAPREVWLSTSRVPVDGSDEDLTRVALLHVATVCYEAVQQRTLFCLGLLDRRYEPAVSPDGVCVC